jgi:hypothetical protein
MQTGSLSIPIGGTFQPNSVTIYDSTTIAVNMLPSTFTIVPGPYWSSLDMLRDDEANALDQHLGPHQIGELNLHEDRYVIMRRQLFNDLYGLAQDVDRLRNGLLFFRQELQMAAQLPGNVLVLHNVSDLAVKFPDLGVVSARAFPPLVFDDNEQAKEIDLGNEEDDYELDPAKIWRFNPAQQRGNSD